VARIGSSPIDLRQGAAAGCGWVIGIAGANTDELEDTYHTHLVPTLAAVPAFLSVTV
ncbi:MAG: hypothetical protein H7Y38_14495, partial [Armatimonadetes bacterium]|nr:hypothetical protein [Armatimonadota bacterium]